MQIHRERYIERGQMFVRFVRTPTPGRIKPRLMLMSGQCEFATENNWMRRILYFFNAPRRITRRV